MNVQVSIKCTGCEFTSRIHVKKPALFKPTLDSFDCPCCKSTVLARVSIAKPGMVNIGTKITKPSPMLLQLWREEAEAK